MLFRTIASASSGGLNILLLGLLFSGGRMEYLKLLSAVLYFSLTTAICSSTEYASI